MAHPAYTGHVEPDGDTIERLDGGLLVRKFSVGGMDNNVYVIACSRTNAALIVDAAARADRIRRAVADLSTLAVVQTHGHWDHVRAWDDLREDPGLPIWGHPGDAELFPRPVDRELADGDVLDVGDLRVEVLHTPGHTDGSLHYLVEGAERPHLFTGDSLFPGGHGRTTTAEDHERIMDGLEEKIFDRLPDHTWVYPGHGDDTTLGTERPHLREWRDRGW
jgi:glyoxylase-like metal-dependent hydrolase (beta-lactamase superfamily II)